MKSLEIFSGAGGLAKGLELAGFAHAAFVEFNKHACASLRENFDPKKVYFGDIKDFDLDGLDGVDVVAGGPPCQPFSLGGKHGAEQDHRDMFPYAIRAIEKLAPKAFIFENVKGLLRPSFADYFEYIILRLTYPGFVATADWKSHLSELRSVATLPYAGTKYKVSFKLINAANYGVPQMRERVVIVGTRDDLGMDWSFPAETHSEDKLLWDMYVSGAYWQRYDGAEKPVVTPVLQEKIERLKARYGLFEPEGQPWRTVRDALHGIPDPRIAHGIDDHLFHDGARSYPGHTGSDIDWPAKTIKAGGHGVPGGENMVRYRDGTLRYFTVHEAKRIQTFPDDFVIKGAWGEAMRQIGNAVPVLWGVTLGLELASQLQAIESTKRRARR
ncbi:MAG: DNA (cytosine-5-)-methyltransferase [Gallionellales bacterium RIFOXYB12_FULL_54_9]|nr:MAG: DNA (cytosine-5-)-methyltransferase [Gallionellales bacterium RIFOXYB12_FULL_54_9]